MRATDEGEKNPLRCPICDDYRYLSIDGYSFKDGTKKIGIKLPSFQCKNCDSSTLFAIADKPIYDNDIEAKKFYDKQAKMVLKDLNENQVVALQTPFENKKFPAFDSLGFEYDSQDYFYIPGLYRSWNEGFLCPVFFDKEVLLHYNNHPDFRVVFASYSRLHILDKENNPIIPHGFGINRSGKIICWLGDLEEEFSKKKNERNKKIFLAFNEKSDHDIISDYYFNQIEVSFMKADNEKLIFELRNEFDEKIIKSKGQNLTHINLDNLMDDYKHPILNETDQINSSFIKLNSILIESFNVSALKGLIENSGISKKEIKGLKGLKLFEKFVNTVLEIENGSSLVSPLFILYDLRVLAGHIKDSKHTEKLKSCKERLGLNIKSTELEVYEKLVISLIDMYTELNKNCT